ncbi:MAG: DNA polymerase III subunit chi [Alphaproteobacteria bacterium]|nr:MAG: DNA polymerase III subunit chi [Alphaproteobacteria bacterium]
MTEVGFYHLQRQSVSQALPRLLERVGAAGLRAVVMAGSEERIEALDAALWTYDPDSFLAHGTRRTGFSEEQPVYLTTQEENPNGATVLVLVDGVTPAFMGSFDRCVDMFDGNDEAAVAAARARWKACKAAGHEVTYWRQSPQGRWEKKA